MAKFIQISNAVVPIPMQGFNPLTRQPEVRVQIAHAIFGLLEDGTVWEFDASTRKWKPLPMDLAAPDAQPLEEPSAPDADRFKL